MGDSPGQASPLSRRAHCNPDIRVVSRGHGGEAAGRLHLDC